MFRDDVFAWPGDGKPKVFDGRNFPVDPNPAGTLHDSGRGCSVSNNLRATDRRQGPGLEVGGLECRAATRARPTYAPRQLVAYLHGDPKATDVPTTGPTTPCSPADRRPVGSDGDGSVAGAPAR